MAFGTASAVQMGGVSGFDRLSAIDAGRRPALRGVPAVPAASEGEFRDALAFAMPALRTHPTGTIGAGAGLEAGVHYGIESPGDDLLSHNAAAAVPSALEDFTAVFGMGTGVAPPLGSPGQKMIRSKCGSV